LADDRQPRDQEQEGSVMAGAAVEVKIAGTEAFQALARSVAGAAESFARLSDEEKAALPAAAREGIEALARASGEPAGPEPCYHGYVVLEWPQPVTTLTFPRAMVAWNVAVYDACEGTPVTTVSKLTVRASADSWVIADMTMLADEQGMPIRDGKPVIRDSKVLEGTFSFLVSGMRVRP
jgi:hypothetical protein